MGSVLPGPRPLKVSACRVPPMAAASGDIGAGQAATSAFYGRARFLNCSLEPTEGRELRGGNYGHYVSFVSSSYRYFYAPEYHGERIGVRRARSAR